LWLHAKRVKYCAKNNDSLNCRHSHLPPHSHRYPVTQIHTLTLTFKEPSRGVVSVNFCCLSQDMQKGILIHVNVGLLLCLCVCVFGAYVCVNWVYVIKDLLCCGFDSEFSIPPHQKKALLGEKNNCFVIFK